MKRNYFLSIILLFIVSAFNLFSADTDLGIRYLKLAGSYRESGEYDLAEKFIDKARGIFYGDNSFKGRYWSAVANEYSAYIFCDQGKTLKAKSALLSAIDIYDKIIKIKDGSQEAAHNILQNFNEDGCPCQIKARNIDEPDYSAIAGDDDDEGNAPLKLKKTFTDGKSRDYSKSGLSDIPEDLPKNVQNLNLSSNRFSAFPEDLSSYKNLRYLDLSGNRINEIPEGLNRFKSLEVLILQSNQVKRISETLCNMKNLRVLDLRANPVSFIQIKKLLQCMPNTLIYHDEFQKKTADDDEE